jgi:hypothetical protein
LSLARSDPFARLYAHISGIGGAVGVISLFRDAVEWRGFFRDLVEFWGAYVTPIARFLFGWIELIVPVTFPSLLYDYLMLGLIFALGVPRFRVWIEAETRTLKTSTRKLLGDRTDWADYLWTVGVIALIAWPVYLAFVLVLCVDYVAPNMRTSVIYYLLSPFLYGLLFFGLNYALFAAGLD